MEDVFESVRILKEFCAHRLCNACEFNRAENGCYDCMLTNESPSEWDVTQIGGDDDAG